LRPRRAAAIVAALLVIAAPFAASADEAAGTIVSFNIADRTITLSNGTTYRFPNAIDLPPVEVNSSVTITYVTVGADRLVYGLRVNPDAPSPGPPPVR